MQNSRNIFSRSRIHIPMRRIAFPAAMLLVVIGSLCFSGPASAQSIYENYTFVNFAGAGNSGPGWFDGVGTAARVAGPVGLAEDSSGNIYLADSGNHTIRKIAPDGMVTTLAGLAGSPGSADGLGGEARFNTPYGIAVGNDGTVYVADSNNHTIRKITTAGMVTTIAGQAGVRGFANNTGSAAQFNFPRGITVDNDNNLFVTDTSNDTIRKITPKGAVTTIAGFPGHAGARDSKGDLASFNLPVGIVNDGNGNLYVADFSNNEIRKVTTKGGVVTTLAGSVGISNIVDGINSAAHFENPFGITFRGPNELFVTDQSAKIVRLVTTDGSVTTIAGSVNQAGNSNALGTNATFFSPGGIVADDTNLYVSDFGNSSIRKISATFDVTTFVGSSGAPGSADGNGSAAQFNSPADVKFDGADNAYVADQVNDTIRKITPDGTVSTLAGNPGVEGTNDGTGSGALFTQPLGVAIDKSGNIFVADTFTNTIREITPQGVVSTLAGSPSNGGTNNGAGPAAQFNAPFSLAAGPDGNVYVSDTHNQAIRQVTPNGVVSTFAGTIGTIGFSNAVGLAAQFDFPEGVAFDSQSNLYVVDDGSFTIRKIAPDGTVTTFAGTAGTVGSADGVGTNATFGFPFGTTVDSSGNVYVVDSFNELIRKITPAGNVTTIAGIQGKTGNIDGTGPDALFSSPENIGVDSQGNVYVADAGNHAIRKGYPAPPDVPIVDRVGGATGVPRQLSVSNLTTTSWSWSLVRRPSGSSAQFSSTNTPNPTFTPDVEDVYIIQFQGWDNSGHTVIHRLSLFADGTPPTISIINPSSGLIASNSAFTIQGTATDNLGVSNVWIQFNDGPFMKAIGTANWSTNVTLNPGTNSIRAFAEDFAGNLSQTNEADLRYIVSGILSVQIKGGGTVTPNLNNAFLEIGKTYSMTAKPAAGSTFSNWVGTAFSTNSRTITFIMQSNTTTFTANFIDGQNPTLLITSPKNNQVVSNASFILLGTAKDNDQVTNVFYQLDGGGWTNAIGTTNWGAFLTLNPGTNTILAYAQDPSGNVSTTNTANVIYVPSVQLLILTTGQGTLTPNLNGSLVAIGTNYTVTAKASAGYFFSNWVDSSGNVLSTNPALTIALQSNSIVTANFSTNFMFQAQGSYAGLFCDTNNVTATNAGFFTATVTSTGAFSAKMLLAGSSVSASGQFSSNGLFSGTVTPKNSTPIDLELQLDLTGLARITGTISNGGWSVPLVANQLVFSSKNPPSQQLQRFTLVIPGSDDSADQPGGNGFGAITIDNFGTVTFTGTLADGNKGAQKTFISRDGDWPFYISTDSGQGVMLGWLNFSPGQVGNLDGRLYWQTQPNAATLYPAGFDFTNGIDVAGSFYNFFVGTPTLTNDTRVILQLAGVSPPITNYFTLIGKNVFSSTNNLKATFTLNTGMFKGTAFDPVNNVSIPFSGIALQNTNEGFGFFIDSGQSGSVFIGP